MKHVSIIIVNWNGKHLLARCLDSIIRQTYQDYEIIVVDNGSADESALFLRENYPQVKIVELHENKGFTGGNNEGFRNATGNLIALLNNDACLTETWLDVMVKAVLSADDIGFCSAKILIDGTTIIDSVGDVFTTAFTGTKVGELEDEVMYAEPRFVSGACAAAAIYRRSMLDQIGFFDDDFFLNHEDTDLNLRAWLAGWRCLFVPEAVAYHRVSSSIGVLSDTSVYYFARNSEWVWFKNVPFCLMIRCLPQRLLYEINSFVSFCLIAGKWRAYFRGKRDALLNLPKILLKRKQLQALRKLSTSEIYRGLVPITRYLRNRLHLTLGTKSTWKTNL